MTVADLNFGNGSWEDARGMIRQLLADHQATIHGNGREGMKTTLDNFITEYRENRRANIEFQNQRDEENSIRESRRWKLLTVFLTALSIAVALLLGLEGNRQLHGNFTLNVPNAVVSSSHKPQDAELPTIVTR